VASHVDRRLCVTQVVPGRDPRGGAGGCVLRRAPPLSTVVYTICSLPVCACCTAYAPTPSQ
jgi:hypothetical protein